MRTPTKRLFLSVSALAATTLGCGVWSSPSDYSAYRAYRYEAAGPERLAAGGRYLTQHADGRFAGEVRGVVLAQEEDFWADHRSSVDGLNEYLRAFPVGTHLDEARERLRVFEQARAQQEAERRVAAEAERVRRETELREASARQRLWMRTQFNRWVRLFGGLNGWGQGMGPIVQGNPDFGSAFENDPPQCRAAHCRKNYNLDFYIPVPGRSAVPRRIGFTLDMVRVGTDRLVNQTQLLVHNRGLTAWWELENQQIADAESAEAREAAVRWTMDQLRAATAASFPEAHDTPAELYGPPPEAVMQGVEDDDTAEPTPVDPNACVVPSQPLGTRWSAVVGCEGITTPRFTAPQEATEAHAHSLTSDEPAVTPHACLRFDAYAAIDGEGMSTDEGLTVTLIPPCAIRPPAPVAPVRPGRPGRPARPAARPAAR
jgi:PAS domain-containing protein